MTKLQRSHDLSAMDTGTSSMTRENRRGFKGAMTFQPWIHQAMSILHPSIWGFKGAMTFQPWILMWRVYRCWKPNKLQRSHDLSAMDTSTGWTPAKPSLSGFKGAMTFQPWIQRKGVGYGSGDEWASKEP